MRGWPKTEQSAREAFEKLAEHLMEKRRRNYASGGYVGPAMGGGIPFQLSRGCVYVTWDTYQKYGRKNLEVMYPDSDIEIVFSAEEVRAAGQRWLDALNEDSSSSAKT